MNKLIFLLFGLLICFFVLFLLLNKVLEVILTQHLNIFLLIILIPLHWKFFDNHCFIHICQRNVETLKISNQIIMSLQKIF